MRIVNEHLKEQRAKRLIAVLRENLQRIRSKDQKFRKACQFHLFRRPDFLKVAAYKALRYYRETRLKMRHHRLYRIFRAFRQGLNQDKIEINGT